MKIAIINEQWTAGATRCARDLHQGLACRHEVCYFPENSKLNAADQLAVLRQFKPDVVHLHSYYGDLPYSFLAEVATLYPTVMTPHDPRPIGDTHLKCWDCNEYNTCFKCPLIGRLKRYTLFQHQYYLSRREKRRIHNHLPKRTTFVCVSEWMRQRLLKTELKQLRVEMIHNGIDLQQFCRARNARQELNLPADGKVIVFVAHHSGWTADMRKGGHVLAQALAEVVIPKFPDLIVLAVGGGMVPNLPNIRPIGFVSPERVARYYSAANVFVAPSLADNLPYTILEAMGCEVPVVASRVGGIPEQILDGKTGRLFLTGSWKELGAALVDTLSNPMAATSMGKAGRQRVEELFALPVFIQKYESIYASLSVD